MTYSIYCMASKKGLIEWWKALAVVGLLLIAAGVYTTYYGQKINFAQQGSYLTVLDKAQKLNLVSGNFSTVNGRATLSISPVGGYVVNGTLSIIASDPNAQIVAYANVPIEKLSGGVGNATYSLPLTEDPINLDILFTFSEVAQEYEITFSVASTGVTNSTTVYALPS
ncbi:MAG: hypothetical protein QXS29_06130 [Nitrososphaeria archaeon]